MKLSPLVETYFASFEEELLFLQEQRKKREEYWARIRIAQEHYKKLYGVPVSQDLFWDWLKKEYGVAPKFFYGNISEDYEIVDEKLYLLFLLKFSQ